MATRAATEVSSLEQRFFVGMVIVDTLVSLVVVVYLQAFPADREVVSLIWGAVLLAGTVTYWTVRRRETRRLRERMPSTTANSPHGHSSE